MLSVGGPSLQKVTDALCPDDKPYKCLPYGECFGFDSYCNSKSQLVESCFPHHLTTNESKLAYCQDVSQNISKIRPACRFACTTISEIPAKSQVCEMGGPSLQKVTDALCPDDKPYKCLPYGECFGFESYCNSKSQLVESCFPHHLTTNESKLAYCQDVSQNISKIRPACRFACMTISEIPAKLQVCESCSNGLEWKIVAIVAIVALYIIAALVIYLCMQKRKWKKAYQRETFQCQNNRADGSAVEDEETVLDLHRRNDVDLGRVTPTQSQTQNQQLNPTPISERTNDNPQLQQSSVTNRDSGDRSQASHSSGNVFSSSSTSVSSVGTNDDSGINSGREGLIDDGSLVQQLSQTQALTIQNGGFNQQSQSAREADGNFVTSIPDGGSQVATSRD